MRNPIAPSDCSLELATSRYQTFTNGLRKELCPARFKALINGSEEIRRLNEISKSKHILEFYEDCAIVWLADKKARSFAAASTSTFAVIGFIFPVAMVYSGNGNLCSGQLNANITYEPMECKKNALILEKDER
ncbi:hypothetical protein KIN20_027604 [Parelaphostrongylus tenuis]|uniref:Uncharacterized protein n=1 Tax=Parelaphostrongylus tenuis TaxID=148309 RepID=A0AAD5WDY5_PARTN|nr:hypothetical protein KIN20_027604 [Parelaphostrongylus tenuis]